jgi:hypothetical protein
MINNPDEMDSVDISSQVAGLQEIVDNTVADKERGSFNRTTKLADLSGSVSINFS